MTKGCKHPKRSAATATHTSEPRHKGSKDIASGRQRYKIPTRNHVSVSDRGIHGNRKSLAKFEGHIESQPAMPTATAEMLNDWQV